MSEWKFRRRQGVCSACEVRFADGDRHVSSLVIVSEEVQREDHCPACFAKRQGTQDLFYWHTRHRIGKRALQLDLSTLEQLFLQLEGHDEPRVRELRYVLCLLLLRKRRLKLDRVVRGTESEGEAMILHRPRRKESLRVFVFDFQPDRLEALKSDLLRLLEGAGPEIAGEGEEASQDPDPSDGVPAGVEDDEALARA